MSYDIKFLFNPSTSMEVRKYYFIGVSTQIILDRSLFGSNDSLHPLIAIFEDFFQVKDKEGNPGFRPYLFNSRTILCARINRLISQESDSTKLKKLFESFYNFFNDISSDSIASHQESNNSTLLQDMKKGLNRKNGSR